MMLWILIAAMTAAAALSILLPLSRRHGAGEGVPKVAADEAVYREQLDEVERDLDRCLIDPPAAEAARTEIARRLLAANERRKSGSGKPGSPIGVRVGKVIAIVALPVFTLGLYMVLGSPGMPDQPLAARLAEPPDGQSVEELVARVERHLAQNPQDGQGWAVIAPVLMRMGDPQGAARAYANAVRLLGPTPERVTDMGEAMTMANDGIISASARAAFEQAVELDPAAVKPRFFLALALGQEGRTEDAIAAWQSLLDGANPDALWVPAALDELAKLGGDMPEFADQLSGPTQEQVEAASNMAPEDQASMIAGMVQGLADRLSSEGGSPDEWIRLMRAYSVLGDSSKGRQAYESAVLAYGDQPADLAKINAAARELGLGES
ncbi:c-type cytochrome biogenesis protein CcmI [Roseibium aquae]|uniref:C-type cytochrome biogenesis protein CcmI n=1 Tax=Roseibium aquae TaxID=1323746 RepID=A0A916TN35_9HYPH|nr:c-type cytochrome biogenesis protein CcmI [Roseibium aquae]GGB63211.1 c-type cytochrome biogenesis protein CcmI [Roseibium aquae]